MKVNDQGGIVLTTLATCMDSSSGKSFKKLCKASSHIEQREHPEMRRFTCICLGPEAKQYLLVVLINELL